MERQPSAMLGSHLRDLLIATRPQTLLAVGAGAATYLADFFAAAPGLPWQHLRQASPPEALDALGCFDVVFVADAIEHLHRREATLLLARLRDRHAGTLYLRVPVGPSPGCESLWEQNDFFALGMECVGVYGDADNEVHLYRFDLRTYKTTPDWFNSKYWAHPELWDKY